MARRLKSDTLLFSTTMLLLVVSVACVYSASAVSAAKKFDGDAGHFLVRQVLWIGLGLGSLLVTMRIDYRTYRQPAVLMALLGATVAGLLAVFFCSPIKGSHRWLGFSSLGVQPSEFAKMVVILFVAAALQEWLEHREELRPAVVRIATVVGVLAALIVVEPDFGSAATLVAIVLAMVFVAGMSWKWLAGTAVVVPPLAYGVLILEPYRADRLAGWLDPWSRRFGEGFHAVQSMIAVGTGGVWGRGFMGGVQKMDYLPEPHNDYIYAVIAEELGLVGATLVLAFFCVLVWRGLRIAGRTPDAFGSLVATGITAMLGLQAMVNISVVLNLLPAKGIALPFVSAGGSSMVVSLTAMGILLNVSQHATD